MTEPADERRTRARMLMMSVLDGEASPEERRQLELLLEGSAELREEWTRLGRVKETTTTMAMRELPDEVWDHYWGSVYNRAERGLAWLLISLGAVVVLGYGLWRWLEAVIGGPGLPPAIRAAILAVAVGLAILVVSVVREKFVTRRHDPYRKGVIR